MIRIRSRITRSASWLALAVLLAAAPLQAGPIFIPGTLTEDKFTPAEGAPCHCYSIRSSYANLTVDDAKVRVQIEETIEGPEKATPAVAIIPLPEGSDGKEIEVTYAGKPAGDVTFLTPQKAQGVFEIIARGTGLTKLLAYSGKPVLLVHRVTLQSKATMTLNFSTPIHRTQGVNWISCPMPAANWTLKPVDRLSVTATLKTGEPLRSVFSPTHNLTVSRKNLNEATALLKADRWSGLDDFRLFWVADKDDLGLRVLAYRTNPKEDGYFMLVGNPTGAAAEKAVAKDVLLVMDTSGSMRGEKIEQARSALDYCLQQLSPNDRFNVVTFGTVVKNFRDDLTPVNPANRAAAREFVEAVVANGQTNIAGSLEKALAGKPTEGRERIMIFVTDGAPTVGERVPEKILEQVKKLNTAGTKIFVMGVGHDVNAHLLDQLAEVTDGSCEYVAPREELDAKVATLYDRLSHPVLSQVKVSFGEAATKNVLPSKLPVLFKGSDIMMVGRYKEGGKHTFTISGTLAGQETKYTCEAILPKEAGEVSNEFLAPLWAARQIGYLLQEIRLRGANKELIEEVVRLSKQYGIVTEYTEFLAFAGPGGDLGGRGGPIMPRLPGFNAPAAQGGFGPGDAVAEAGKRLDMARKEQAGQWAVNQAFNDRQLQNRLVAGNEANTYRDRRGRDLAVKNIVQMGQRAFYLQEGQWVDAEEPGTRKTRTVKLFSDEYFELLRKDPTFAKAQNLSWAMSINIGDERIVIEKEGKTQDETLKPKVEPILEPGFPGQQQQQIPGFNRDRGLNQIPGKELNLNRIQNELQQQIPRNRNQEP